MQVTFIPGSDINSDLGVVNAARVSLHKHHDTFVEPDDSRLIAYLAKHNHWTPFAHSRLYFEITWPSAGQQLFFYKNANLAGFSMQNAYDISYIKGSLYAWLHSLQWFNSHAQDAITDTIARDYPVTASRFLNADGYPSFTHTSGIYQMTEQYVECYSENAFNKWHLACATLLVKVPIFIARQIRTSQVGFAYSDLYIEGEAFVYNEVSRRYVDDDPEFYNINEWRVREGGSVKQGSTGLAGIFEQTGCSAQQQFMLNTAGRQYIVRDSWHIAPEQSRALLPQSMYTEYYMTGTLHRWAQFLALRLDTHVQLETRQCAAMIATALTEQYPAWADAYNIPTLIKEAL